ncbi:hypothetical protein BSKO_05280 [Bryopsis sp. KO-2023]|nr:hypothetical protein BSKO_05280 [Bryopsis sp. KO-2023]
MEELSRTLSTPMKEFMAGAFGGMLSVTVGQPLDTVKIRLQEKNSPHSTGAQVWKHMVSREGRLSVFKGMAYPFCTVALQTAVTFLSFGVAMRLFPSKENMKPEERYTQAFWSGMFSGAAQAFVVAPVDLLKIRLQLQRAVPGNPGYVGAIEMLKKIIAKNGIRGMFRGQTITLIRDTPSLGVYFYLYHRTKDALDPPTPSGQSESPAAMFFAGGIAGVLSWLAVYPIDVVKSRIQCHDKAASPYRGWVDCWRSIAKEEGHRTLWRGLTPTLQRAFLTNAAIFSGYEAILRALNG